MILYDTANDLFLRSDGDGSFNAYFREKRAKAWDVNPDDYLRLDGEGDEPAAERVTALVRYDIAPSKLYARPPRVGSGTALHIVSLNGEACCPFCGLEFNEGDGGVLERTEDDYAYLRHTRCWYGTKRKTL